MTDRVRNVEAAGGNTGWNHRLQASPSHGLTIAAAIAALVLLVNVSLNRRNTHQLVSQGSALVYSYRVLGHLNETLSLAKDAETSARGFLITGDPLFLAPYNKAVLELPKLLSGLDSLTRNDSVQRARMPVLRERVETSLSWLRETARIRSDQGMAASEARVRTGVGKAQMDSVRAIVAVMRSREDSLLQRRTGLASNAYDQVLRSGLLAAIGAFLAFLALGGLIWRHMKARALAHQETLEQRAYFENTLRSIDDTVITTDERGNVSGLNAAAARMTGWTEGEATGRALNEVLVMRSASGEELPEDGAMPTNPGTAPPLVVVENRQGQERLAELRRSTIRNDNRAEVGSVVVLADVTDSVEAKARLVASDTRLRSALQTAGMLAWEYDIHADRFTFSDNAASILGLTDNQRLGSVSSTLAICHPADLGKLKQAVAATI
ncbi:MAG: CHASE3 domain-containing protein, partial [Steroidobacteraceae bacterium]